MTRRMRGTLLSVGGVGIALLVTLTMAREEDRSGISATRTSRQQTSGAPAQQAPVVDLKLELLSGARPELREPERDPFRFRPKPAPEPPRKVVEPQPPAQSAPAAPTGPPPPPPIQLRFIGLVDAPTQAVRVAIVSDGRGNVFYGREGDTIEGRYKILRVGPDVIDLAYLDGRGRQTIRLTGQ